MSIEFVDGGRTWRVYTDPQGRVHDEPVEPAAEPHPWNLRRKSAMRTTPMHNACTHPQGRGCEACRLATVACLLGPLLMLRDWAQEHAYELFTGIVLAVWMVLSYVGLRL